VKDRENIPLTRAIGQFFGHLWHSSTKPAQPDTHTETISKTTEEADAEINGNKVILRKTTIEEVEFRDEQ
jgi:hypothetical protein